MQGSSTGASSTWMAIAARRGWTGETIWCFAGRGDKEVRRTHICSPPPRLLLSSHPSGAPITSTQMTTDSEPRRRRGSQRPISCQLLGVRGSSEVWGVSRTAAQSQQASRKTSPKMRCRAQNGSWTCSENIRLLLLLFQ